MIVEAAARLFLEHGYQATSIGRIAADAGVAVQTIYNAVALPRTAAVFRIIREAAAADPEIATLERGRSAQRLRNYRQAAQLLADRGGLRAGLTIDAAAATIFAIGHPESYRALVLDGAWDDDTWAAWVQATLESALL